MTEKLLEASKQLLKWYDDENDRNPHSTEEWRKAYGQLRNEVNFISSNLPVMLSLPSDGETEKWFEENIGIVNDCSASSAIYKFRLWLKERREGNGA